MWESRFVEAEEGVLRRVPLGSYLTLQIVVPEAFRPILLILEHHALISGYTGQKRM